HFTTAEAQCDLDLVTIFQEALDVAKLDLIVALVRCGTKLDFLDLDDFLLQAGVMLALLLLVPELAVIHQTAHRRLRGGSNFDQIDVVLLGEAECLDQLDDAKMFSVDAYQAHFGCMDLAVDAIGLVGCDVDDSLKFKNAEGRTWCPGHRRPTPLSRALRDCS